jgi:hypothetical protein
VGKQRMARVSKSCVSSAKKEKEKRRDCKRTGRLVAQNVKKILKKKHVFWTDFEEKTCLLDQFCD